MLNHTDDATTQMSKLAESMNLVTQLTGDLIKAGQELNEKKGKFTEIKARIKAEKERINCLKVLIRAENNQSY